MKKLATLSFIAIIGCMLVLHGCKKETNGNVDEITDLTDPVDDELNDLLSSIPSDTTIKASDLTFDDGTNVLEFIQDYDPGFLNDFPVLRTTQDYTPEEQKKLLIGKMEVVAYNLVSRTLYKNYKGSNQPNGLAYNWGSKNYTIKTKPVKYNNKDNICDSALYGLDCSGMIYVMAKNANLNIASTATCCKGHGSHAGGGCATFMKDTANWNKFLRESTTYKDLRAKLYNATGVPITDPSYINFSKLEVGDLIFKTDGCKAIHVGMILAADFSSIPGRLSIYQSNGYPDKVCDVNKSKTSGPRIISLTSSEAFGNGSLFGIDWKVVRFETSDCDGLSTFTDPRDGQTYKIVQIGSQTWMAENLNYATGNSWCYDNNAANCNTYGRLYDWQTALSVCPAGWHLPSDAEWSLLINYLGGESVAGGKMKSKTGWNPPNVGATNETCFSGLPGGLRNGDGDFIYIGGLGIWWSSSASEDVIGRYLVSDNSFIDSSYIDPVVAGLSVRCLRD